MSNLRADTFRLEIDKKGFDAVIERLANISGKTREKTIKAELGHVFVGAIKQTPIATTKAIVKRTIPEGKRYKGQKGGRLVTMHTDGKKKHVGRPIKSVKGEFGGQYYKLPYPFQSWIGYPIKQTAKRQAYKTGKKKGRLKKIKKKDRINSGEWPKYIFGQERKADKIIARKGLTAGVFYWMAKEGKVRFPRQPKGANLMRSKEVTKLVRQSIRVKDKKVKNDYTLAIASVGMKVAGRAGLQRKLDDSIQRRQKLFLDSMQKGFIDDLKKFMPKYYPLLFK